MFNTFRLLLILLSVTLLTACAEDPAPTPPANQAPSVSAGSDQTVTTASIVTVIGSATDSDGSIASYLWEQVNGSELVIANASQNTATFTAPTASTDTQYTIRLTVTDNGGISRSDQVMITVTANPVANNLTPNVNAGADQRVTVGNSVSLTGIATDSDGTIAAYQWEQVGSSDITLIDATSATARFNVPSVNANANYTFRLTVTDDAGGTNSDEITVTVTAQVTGSLTVRLSSTVAQKPSFIGQLFSSKPYNYQASGTLLFTPDSLTAAIEEATQIAAEQIAQQQDGSYLISDLPVGSNGSLAFTNSSGGEARNEITISAGQNTEITLDLVPTHTLDLQINSAQHTSLQLDINALGINNYPLETNSPDALNGLPTGRHFITLSNSSGAVLLTRFVQIPAQGPLILELDDAIANNSLTGLISDSSGAPIDSATVFIKPDSDHYQIALTDSSGHYSLNAIKAGSYTLIITKHGYASHKQEGLTIGSGVNTLDTITLDAATTTGGIAGFVYFNDLDAHTGIDITLEKVGGGYTTNQFGSLPDGAYLAGELPPGLYNLHFGKAGDSSYSSVSLTDIEVVAGVTHVIEAPTILQHLIGTLSGSLTIPNDFGDTSNLTLELIDANNNQVTTFPISDSSVTHFEFSNIPTADGYTLQLSGSNLTGTAIVAQQITNLDVTTGNDTAAGTLNTMLQLGNLSGSLALPAGFGDLSNLSLILSTSSGTEIARTTPNGLNYSFNNLAPGSGYQLTVTGSNYTGSAISANILTGVDITIGETTDLSNTPLTATLQQSVTQGDNRAPDLISITTNVTSAPTITLNYQVQDPEGDAISCRIDWGNGSSSVQSIDNCYNTPQSHTYTELGDYTILFSATDGSGTIVWNQTVPVIYYPFLSRLDLTSQSGRVVELSGGVQNTSQLTIDWGDDSDPETLTEGLDDFLSFHQYPTAGSYTLSLSGDSGEQVARTLIIQDNLPPVITLGQDNGIHLNTMALNFSAFDPEDDAFSCQIDWGDNSLETIEVCNQERRSHDYSSVGAFTITVTATDAQSQSSTLTLPANITTLQQDTLTVDSLTVTPLPGSRAQLTGSIAVDAGFAELSVDWGDGTVRNYTTASTNIDYSNLSLSYAYAQTPGTLYTVTLTITDLQGNISSAQRRVEVAQNYAPEIVLHDLDVIKQDVTLAFSASDRDSDPFSCAIDWGDSQSSSISDCSLSTTHSHHYAPTADANRTIVISATDDLDNSRTYEVVADINTIPIIDLTASEDTNQTTTLTGTINDLDGTIGSVILDWGDGNIVGLPESTPLSVDESHRYDVVGPKQITVTAYDLEGAKQIRSYWVDARLNSAPAATTLNLNGTDSSSVTLDYAISASSEVTNTHQCLLEWGDGTMETLGSSCSSGQLDHSYASGIGSDYPVVFHIADSNGRRAHYVADADMNSLKRTYTPAALPSLHLTGSSDPTAQRLTIEGYMLNTTSATINWGEGTIDTISNNFFTIRKAMDYGVNGPFAATVSATNPQGSTSAQYVTLFNVGYTVNGIHDASVNDAMQLTTVAGEALNFAVPDSYTSYEWDFSGLLAPATSATPDSVTFANVGSYPVTLNVVDANGLAGQLQWQIEVVADLQPTVTIDSPTGNIEIWQGESINFLATATGGNEPLSYAWDFAGLAPTNSTVAPGLITMNTVGSAQVTLTITDFDLERTTASFQLRVKPLIAGEFAAPTSQVTVFAPHQPPLPEPADIALFAPYEPGETPAISVPVYAHATYAVQLPNQAVDITLGGPLDLGVIPIYARQGVDFSANIDATALIYEWDYGGSTNPQSTRLTLFYSETGDYPVTLTVLYNDGSTEIYTLTIQVSEAAAGLSHAPRMDSLHIMAPYPVVPPMLDSVPVNTP